MKKNFEVTRILPYKHTLLFEQIADFERYEQYLPFCNASRSLNTDNKDFSQIGELEFEIAGVNYKIKSGNIIEDERILITQIKGPFDEMKASWDVEQVDDGKTVISFKAKTEVSFFLGALLGDSTIEKFVNIVGKERVIAGTDCGFGTFAGFGNVDPDIAYLKLQSLVEGAGQVK